VTRALEDAASRHADGGVRAGAGLATQRLGAHSELRVVDVLLSGTHEPGTSHHALLRAFVDEADLQRMDAALAAHRYRTHEFGDSVWVAAQRDRSSAGQRSQRSAQRQQGDEGWHGQQCAQGEELHGWTRVRGVENELQTPCVA
jgi:S-adenosylmethionine:tRNA ribosyltransferase-isomerase